MINLYLLFSDGKTPKDEEAQKDQLGTYEVRNVTCGSIGIANFDENSFWQLCI